MIRSRFLRSARGGVPEGLKGAERGDSRSLLAFRVRPEVFPKSTRRFVLLGLAALVALAILALGVGALRIPPLEILGALTGPGLDPTENPHLLDVGEPRNRQLEGGRDRCPDLPGPCHVGAALCLRAQRAGSRRSRGGTSRIFRRANEEFLIILASATVGVSVAFTGMIGFVGLVVPHLVRLSIGPDAQWLLPGSALLGALILTLADTIARTVVAPAEIPIGALTAACGGPAFLFMLLRQRRRALWS